MDILGVFDFHLKGLNIYLYSVSLQNKITYNPKGTRRFYSKKNKLPFCMECEENMTKEATPGHVLRKSAMTFCWQFQCPGASHFSRYVQQQPRFSTNGFQVQKNATEPLVLHIPFSLLKTVLIRRRACSLHYHNWFYVHTRTHAHAHFRTWDKLQKQL